MCTSNVAFGQHRSLQTILQIIFPYYITMELNTSQLLMCMRTGTRIS